MWLWGLWLGFAVWVFLDAKRRCTDARYAIGVFALSIVFLPLYFAKRNLYKGEIREGGVGWNVVKVFALYWTITMALASLAGLVSASKAVVEQTSDAAQAGAAIGTAIGMGLMIGLWFTVLVMSLVIGLFLRKASVVETGPTGELAGKEGLPDKLGVSWLVAWVAIVFVGVFVASATNKDAGGEEKAFFGTSTSNEDASRVLPVMEAQFIEVVSTARRKSRGAENDMQRGGIKIERDRALCRIMASRIANDWIGTVEEVGANSDGKGVLTISIAEDIKVQTWNNAFSDIGSGTLIEPGDPVFNAASAIKRGQQVLFSGIFLRGSQDGDCLRESSFSLRGKIEEPEFIFKFSKISSELPVRQSPVTESSEKSVNNSKYVYPLAPNIVLLQGHLIDGSGEDIGPDGNTMVPVTFPALKLDTPITVKGDEGEENAAGIDLLQIVLIDKEMWQKLKGQMVSIKGTLYHGFNSHHQTPVLITASEIATGQ